MEAHARILDSPWGELVAISIVVLLLALILQRRGQRERTAPSIGPSDREVAQLRSQIQQLELRHQAQLDFFITFPEVVKSLTAALTWDQVTSACSRGITALLRTRQIALFLAESKTHLRLEDGAGFPPELRRQLLCPVEEAGLIEVLSNRGVSSLRDHPRAADYLQRHRVPAELAVPLCQGESQLGLLVVAGAGGEPQVVRRILAMLADLTAVGLLAARKVHQIRDEAENDPLTGLANRRTLLARMNREIHRWRSYRSQTSLAMVDVDHFKSYNDQNGHSAGDEVLKTVARLMLGATRKTDLVARYGGEEFTVVLCGADRDQAWQHGERIRRAIASHPFPHGEKQPLGLLSISMGIATFPMHAETVEALFAAADRALYRAKHDGRNRLVRYDPAVDGATTDGAAAPADPSQPSHT